MKSATMILIVVAMSLFLCACGGNVKNVKIIEKESEKYSSEEINSAIEIIIKEFKENWKGCKLNKICYAGDESLDAYQDWADRNNANEVIVLLSSFDVDSSGGDGSLEANSTYDDWNWILVRNKGGKWKYVDHGY